MPTDRRLTVLHLSLIGFALAIVARAAQVQLWQGKAWAARAERQHYAEAALPAPRGDILDASGATLAQSREVVRLSIAPREVRERAALERALRRAGVPASSIRHALDTARQWVVLPGRYLAADVAAALAMRGVYAEPIVDRVYGADDGMRRIVGRVGPDGRPVDGLELALDSLLRGSRGEATLLRDARGRRFESPTSPGVSPRPGQTVVLTLNDELQGICERALDDAVARLGASGGDIVVLDPHDGAVLAMASHRPDPRSTASTALTEPFEPGSTLKPFIAATLLTLGRARPDEVIDTHNGVYTVNGRTITDEHKAPRLSLHDVIRFSSNVGITSFAARLTPAEEYQALRDFGFGTPTLVPYPSEASGTLRPPREWSLQSQASLAMGYEIAVTPLQLATAYAAIANGGELLQPALVKEVRDADGTIVYQHEKRVVRRVMSPEVAARIREMLVDVVERGTAVQADLSTYAVAGKTGTARRAVRGVGYAARQYTASFVGLFPATDPQYVILVKLDDPTGASYFGGSTAAPVTKAVLEAALAARDAALDRRALAAQSLARAETPGVRDGDADHGGGDSLAGAVDTAGTGTVPYVVSLGARGAAGARPAPAAAGSARRAVPDVRGLPLRAAVTVLHRAGFRVQLASGPLGTTLPAAGTLAPVGSTIRLFSPP